MSSIAALLQICHHDHKHSNSDSCALLNRGIRAEQILTAMRNELRERRAGPEDLEDTMGL